MKKNIIFAVLTVVLCVILAVSIFNIVKISNSGEEKAQYTSRIIERDGIEYYPRQDITTLLLMGLDRSGPAVASNSYTNSARADVVMIVIFDNTARQINVLNLNRDTILPVQVLGVNGYPAGTRTEQLALAHTYGTGLKDSCENTRATVSSFLYNLQVDYYASVSMDCIATVNDRVGGVEVTVSEDFTAVNPTIPTGTVRLYGEQATAYVRYRRDVGDQLNLSRMERQNQYVEGLFSTINTKSTENPEIMLDIYDEISDYIVTDCSVQTITNLLNKFSGYTFNKTVSLKGENIKGEEFMEFYPDSANLDAVILDLFYSKK